MIIWCIDVIGTVVTLAILTCFAIYGALILLEDLIYRYRHWSFDRRLRKMKNEFNGNIMNTCDNLKILDEKIMKKVSNHECIHEPELLERLHDILIEKDIAMNVKCDCDEKTNEMSDAGEFKEFGEYLKERMNKTNIIKEFKSGYLVIDATDNHVLDNKVFDNKEDAEKLKMEYYHEMPSLIDNHYYIVKCGSDSLRYGSFPYEDMMYFKYGLED